VRLPPSEAQPHPGVRELIFASHYFFCGEENLVHNFAVFCSAILLLALLWFVVVAQKKS
jgi:hypothetical protein